MLLFCPTSVVGIIGARLVDRGSVRCRWNKVYGSSVISSTGATPLAARTLSQPREKKQVRLGDQASSFTGTHVCKDNSIEMENTRGSLSHFADEYDC